jgi:hypothetical protein
MIIKNILVMPIIISIFLSGCATIKGYPDRSGNVNADLQELDRYFSPKIIDQYASAPDKRAFRNEVIYGQIRAIDLHFAKFQQQLVREDFLGRVASRWTVLGLTGAVATGPGATASAVLGAISTGVTGAWETIDQKTFIKETMPALLTKMEAQRKETLVKIMTGLKLGVEEYPLNLALIDIGNYYRAGTIPGALAGITEKAGADAKKAEDKLEQLTGKFVEDQAGETLKKFWIADGKVDKDHEKELMDWIKLKIKEKVSIPSFILWEQYARDREKAVEELNLPREVDEPESKLLRKFIKNADNISPNQKNLFQLLDWMKKNSLMEVSVEDFLYRKSYSDKRKAAIIGLKISK